MVLARCEMHAGASTSGRASILYCSVRRPTPVPRFHGQTHSQPGRGLAPCRVTNEGDEMRIKEIWDRIEADVVEESQYQIPSPELGPLERRVGLTYEDALFQDDISVEETSYWFTEPQGGWNQDPKLIPKAQTAPWEWASAAHPGDDRLPLSDIKDGQVLEGVIIRQMLYHGAQVDLGAEFDGLIPVKQGEWTQDVCEALWLDVKVSVRVHKVRDRRLHRFPIQLELLTPSGLKLSPPEDHHSPLNLQGQGDMKVIEEYTGRKYKPSKFWAEFSPSDAEVFFESKSYEFTEEEMKDGSPYADYNVRARVSDVASML